MARINVYDFVKSISKESISHPDDTAVKVNGKEDLPKNVQEDTRQEDPTDDVDAEVKDTKTTEPGPANGGGDGTAEFNSAEKAKTHVNVKDLHFDGDQNGGRERDQAPNQVKAKDGLSASDVRTSVEEHTQSAEVAELETIETGGAEQVEAADDLVMDIDNEAEESTAAGILSQSEIDSEVMGKILKDVGELEKAKASVEGYLGILASMRKRGVEMSPELRTSMAIGLESISQELFQTEIITLEDFKFSNEAEGGEFVEDDTGFDGTRDKTEKGLSARLKQIWEAIKRAYHRSLSALIDLYRSLTTDTAKLSEHLKGLRKRVGKLEGGKEIQLKNSTRLTMGDEFVGNSAVAVKRITSVGKELLINFPSQLVKVFQSMEKGTGNSEDNFGETLDEFENAIERSFTSLRQLSKNDRDKAPSGFLDVSELKWSEALPGNRALYVGTKRATGPTKEITESSDFANTVRINFSAMPNESTHSGERTIVSPDAAEATEVIRALEDLIYQVAARREGQDAIKKLVSITKSKTWNDIFSSKGANKSTITSMIMAQGLASATTSSEHAFIGYVISTVKAYIGFLEGSIKTEMGGDKGETIDA
ncbi:virion structural protein [Pseudomonas phage Phabio]|uniref:Virion structural protein n=1 Tax=Pseudomonas phage Phabio TaxID=2006668 RepID=A0A1Y0SWJ8_9CAUD|nr:internal head protein [Pseudomonas phage Phabio]ARV76865.1 virion structural protein [Pseudomonas phage Phabio]